MTFAVYGTLAPPIRMCIPRYVRFIVLITQPALDLNQKGGETTMQGPIFAVTMQDILSVLSRRLNVSTLSGEELDLARQVVAEAISHHLDIG